MSKNDSEKISVPGETKLSRAAYWIGDSIEAFGPSIYRILAATLPYATPFPVAWITMRSAESFLGFEPWVAFIFVYGLEGIGIWFTGLFVEAVVDFIKSRNMKTFLLVLIFGAVVAVYVTILVRLNVTLKTSSGMVDPGLSQVITLLCFLPLLTGVGNGYYKLKLENKREENLSKERERQDKLSDKAWKRSMIEKKLSYEMETSSQLSGNGKKVSGNFQKVSPNLSNLVETFQQHSGDWRKFSGNLSRPQLEQLASLTPDQMKEIADCTGYTYKTISNWRSNASQRL